MEVTKMFLELILHKEIESISVIQSEVTIKNSMSSKGIRLDVRLKEDPDKVYNIEMQSYRKANIAKRARYYHSTIDADNLSAGEDYSELPATFVIFVCVFDPLYEGLPFYTFRNFAEEDKEIELEDGNATIFVNVTSDSSLLSESEKALFDFIAKNIVTDDELVQKLNRIVNEIKESDKMFSEYAILTAHQNDWKKEGIDEGIKIGEKKGINQEKQNTALKLYSKGFSISEIHDITGLSEEEIKRVCFKK